MADAELKIDSSSIERTTKAVDALYNSLLEMVEAAKGAENAGNGLAGSEKRKTVAINNSNIASQKAIELLKLEQKNLDKTSQEYAELRGAILAKEVAAKKGIDTSSKEYKVLKDNIVAKEKATAATKSLQNAKKKLGIEQKKTTSATNKFTDSLDKATKQAQLIDGPLGGVASRMTALSSIIKSGAFAFAGIGLASALAFREMAKGVSIAADTEVAMKSFEAQLVATEGAAGFTAEELDKLSRSFAMDTLASTDQLRDMVGVMLTFKNVSGDTFTRSISLAQDLGEALRQDPITASRTLGKVLENPLKNYKQLSRAGVNFSKEQKDQIREAQVQGDLYIAQGIILEELEGKFKDLAKSQADTLRGDIDTFNQKWEQTDEIIGKRLLPTMRALTQAGSEGLDFLSSYLEGDVEKIISEWEEGFDTTKKSLPELEAELKRVRKELDLLGRADAFDKALDQIANATLDKIIPATLVDQIKALTQIEDQIGKVVIARNKAADSPPINEALDEYLENSGKALQGEAKLTAAFLEFGNTRTEGYRKEKSEVEALSLAKKLNIEGNEKEIAKVAEIIFSLSQLTETRVKHNEVLQRQKAEQAKQVGLEKEIALQELIGKGLSKTSEEYVKLTAEYDVKIAAQRTSIEEGSKEYNALLQQKTSTAELTAELTKLRVVQSDTKAFESTRNSLQKEIALNVLKRTGLKETTLEYLKAQAVIEARNQALEKGFPLGSKEAVQLEDQALALAKLRAEAQKAQDFADLGFSVGDTGQILVEGTQAALLAADNELRGRLVNLLVDGEIDEAAFVEKMLQLNETLKESTRGLLNPLGVTVDDEGNQVLLESLEAVEIEKTEKLLELQQARNEGLLTDEEVYLQRKAQIEQEYTEKAARAEQEAFDKSIEHKQRMRQKDIANNVAAGLQNLAAVAGNNKKLARMAKLASIFSASTSLVDSLANAAALPPPLNIPAYAKAFVQGTQLIQMASSLNEPSFAFGGVDIQGGGTGRSDSIKANIAKGESVVTATATQRHKDTLRRMNAGLPIGVGGNGQPMTFSNSITIQGDASEQTVALIDQSLRDFEDRVKQIADGSALQTIQDEQMVGGLFDQF